MLVRDYGLYDHAMLRFAPGHKISENFYVRQDGTRAYYFSEGMTHRLTSVSLYTLFAHREDSRVVHNGGISSN